jgi:hypothetical protein
MKNIYFVNRPGGAFGYITDGLINALRNRGHNVQRWDGLQSSWDDFRPDLYIGSSGHRQPVPQDKNCAFAMHVNPFGPIDCGGINEPPQSLEYIKTMKPDVVWGYGFKEDEIYWKYWEAKFGIPWVPMPTAADITVFKRTTPYDQRNLDVIYVGGRWAYKAKSIDSYLLPMIRHVQAYQKSAEIYGWGDWEQNQSRGIIPDDQVTLTFNRAKIASCISEPHTHMWGFDLPERLWKVAACGCLPIHDPVPTLRQILPGLPMAKNANEYAEMHLHYINNPEERIKLAEEINIQVLLNHTYHNRMAELFEALGWQDEAMAMLKV